DSAGCECQARAAQDIPSRAARHDNAQGHADDHAQRARALRPAGTLAIIVVAEDVVGEGRGAQIATAAFTRRQRYLGLGAAERRTFPVAFNGHQRISSTGSTPNTVKPDAITSPTPRTSARRAND